MINIYEYLSLEIKRYGSPYIFINSIDHDTYILIHLARCLGIVLFVFLFFSISSFPPMWTARVRRSGVRDTKFMMQNSFFSSSYWLGSSEISIFQFWESQKITNWNCIVFFFFFLFNLFIPFTIIIRMRLQFLRLI